MIPLRSFSVLRGKKFLTENCDTPSITPLLIHKIHRNLKFGEEQKGSSTKVFGIFRQKTFDGKFWYSPFLSINLLANDNFSKHSTGLFAYDVNRYCETKKFDRKSWYSLPPTPLIRKSHRFQNFFETQKGSPAKSFGTVGQQFFCRKLWYPLLGINFFDTRNFVKHRKVPLRKDSVLWKKTILTESRGISNTSNIFGYQKFSETRKSFRTNFFGSVRQHIFDDQSWSSPLIHEIFPYQKVFETQKGSPSEAFRRF